MRIVTYHGRPVSRIHHLPSGWLRLKLYERFPDGRPRYLRISSEQWARGRRAHDAQHSRLQGRP